MKTENTQLQSENEIKKDSAVSSYGGLQYKREYEQYMQTRSQQSASSLKATIIMAIAMLFTVSVVCTSAVMVAHVVTNGMGDTDILTKDGNTVTVSTISNVNDEVLSGFGGAVVSVDVGVGDALTGMMITSDGYVLTSASPQLYAESIKVRYNGSLSNADVIGINENVGIAVLKTNVENSDTVKFGYGDAMRSGEGVYISYRGKTGESIVACGYVSQSTTDKFEISNISFKNQMYGAAVLNSYGVVIGIVTGGNDAVTEAVYASHALLFVKQHVNNMYSSNFARNCKAIKSLGMSVISVSDNESEIFGLPGGVMVVKCPPLSLAGKSGILCNDIIIGLDSVAVENAEGLEKLLNSKKGETVSLLVYRDERYITVGCQIEE